MEPLVSKIETQADDSGVRKYEKSLDGVNVSSRKASGALKSFFQDIAQARDGTDVASAALGAFSRVLGSSLAGTGIIIAGKALIDAFAKIDEAVKESEMAVSEAFAGMDKAGKAMSFAEAIGQAKNFEGVAEKIRKKIKEINDSPFTSIIDNITQSTRLMDIQATIAENQAREIKRVGAESELAHLKKMQGLDAENKALELNSRALEKELDGIDAIKESETALAVTRKYQLQADEIRAKFADERNKQELENADKRQKAIEAQIKAEKELAEAQQKRFNDLYDAEIKAQEATQKRTDARNKAEQDLADKRQSLEQGVKTAKEEQKIQAGGAAQETAANMVGGSASRGVGQRETSYETGLRRDIARAEQQGRTASAEAKIQSTIDQIKQERADAGDTRFTGRTDALNRLKDEAVKSGKSSSQASSLTDQLAKNVESTSRALDDFSKSQSKSTETNNSTSESTSNMGDSLGNAIESADKFSEGITKNGGNMVDDFLKGGDSADNLGDSLDDTAESAKDLSEELKKSGPRGEKSGGDGGGGADGQGKGTLSSIETLLQKNFDELKAYAHAT